MHLLRDILLLPRSIRPLVKPAIILFTIRVRLWQVLTSPAVHVITGMPDRIRHTLQVTRLTKRLGRQPQLLDFEGVCVGIVLVLNVANEQTLVLEPIRVLTTVRPRVSTLECHISRHCNLGVPGVHVSGSIRESDIVEAESILVGVDLDLSIDISFGQPFCHC